MTTKKEKEEYAKLARLGCILCRQNEIQTTDTPTELHHCRGISSGSCHVEHDEEE